MSDVEYTAERERWLREKWRENVEQLRQEYREVYLTAQAEADRLRAAGAKVAAQIPPRADCECERCEAVRAWDALAVATALPTKEPS